MEEAGGEGKGFGSQPFMAGAAWFAKSAIYVTDALAQDVEVLRVDTANRVKVLW